jgi:putative FmdB family regulatory protein
VPTYQYQCTECGEGLEVFQKFTDDALTVCPSCEGRLRKVYSAVGIVFKGSGFYRTDSRAAASSSADGSSSSGGSKSKSESKSDKSESSSAKSESKSDSAKSSSSSSTSSSSTSSSSSAAA